MKSMLAATNAASNALWRGEWGSVPDALRLVRDQCVAEMAVADDSLGLAGDLRRRRDAAAFALATWDRLQGEVPARVADLLREAASARGPLRDELTLIADALERGDFRHLAV